MMYKEFAIEPSQIKNLHDLRLIEARFGYDKGALISAFPNKWFKAVMESLNAENGNTKVDTLTDLAYELKERVLHRYSRQYVGDNWLSAAQSSNTAKPFHRVVEPSVMEPPIWTDSIYNLSEADFESIEHCHRTAESMADVAETLLVNAEKITCIDPYFSPTDQGYIKTLKAMMQRCSKDVVSFIVVCEEVNQVSWSDRCHQLEMFKQEIPENIHLTWAFIDDSGTGFLHQRMLFTGKGGVIYDRGFKEPSQLDQKSSPNNLSLMTMKQVQKVTLEFNLAQLPEPLTLAQPIWTSQ